eukprot:328731_1
MLYFTCLDDHKWILGFIMSISYDKTNSHRRNSYTMQDLDGNKKLVVDLNNLATEVTDKDDINKDLDLSSTSCDLPQIFTDYYFHTGPLRADPPPVCEWIERIPDNHATIKNKNKYKEKLQDFTILAETCRRAQKYRQYANCYMSMGIIYDNCKDYKNAVSSYKKFIDILQRNVIIPNQSNNNNHKPDQNHKQHTQSIEFDLGLYAAYNALGVDYQLLADITSTKTVKKKPKDQTSKECVKYFKKSLEYHLKYRDCIMETESNVMNDTNCNSALFIAYTNIGLLLLRCDRVSLAINQFQHALRYSIHINSNIAQSIAICNISLGNVYDNNYSIGRVCMERYLQLVTVLGDVQSQCYAFYNLGTMILQSVEQKVDNNAEDQSNINDARHFFEEAINVCQYIGDKQLQNQLKMKLAVSTVLQMK